MLITKPLVHANFSLTQTQSIPYDRVTCIADSPIITWLVPTRMLTANYYNTAVHSVSLPIVTTLPPNDPIPFGDTLVIADASGFSGGIAPRDGLLFHYVADAIVDIYRGVAGEAWTLLSANIDVVATNHTEERLLPICVTNSGIIAHELVMDCRPTTEMLQGQLLRVSDTVLRIPAVGFPGEQAGLINIATLTTLDLGLIDRFFITNDLQEDLFPYSSTGRYVVFHIVTISGAPYCVIHYGPNFTTQSAALPMDSLVSISGTVALGTTIQGALGLRVLASPGGVVEGNQYTFTSRTYYVGKANPYLDIRFNLALSSIPTTGRPYLTVCINTTLPTSFSIEYPGLLAAPDSVFVVFDLLQEEITIRQPNGTKLNACSGGCELGEEGIAGDWHIRIQALETGSILYLYQNDVLIDYVSLPALDYKRMVRPHLVSWYVNGTGTPITVGVTVEDTQNVIPSQTERNMCFAEQAAGIVSPCMSNAELMALIPFSSYVSMETATPGSLANNQVINSTPAGPVWTLTNGTTPSQILDEGLIDISAKSLYLSDRSALTATSAATTETQNFNIRVYIRLTSNLESDVLILTHTPVNPSENARTITVRAVGATGWMITNRIKSQVGSAVNTTAIQLLETDAVQANTLYCLVLSVDDTTITLDVNGKRYTLKETSSWYQNRMFKAGAVPLHTLSATLTSQQDMIVDDILIYWAAGWSPIQSYALNNDRNTRSALVDCDFQSLLTDIVKRPVYIPGIPVGYGGTIRATFVNSYHVTTTNQVQVYSLPAQYGFGLVDVVLSCVDSAQVTLYYGANANTVLYRTTLTSEGGGMNNIRLSRGMGLFLKVSAPVTIRITSLLG